MAGLFLFSPPVILILYFIPENNQYQIRVHYIIINSGRSAYILFPAYQASSKILQATGKIPAGPGLYGGIYIS
jgi:hypothetical protein